jgi:hypothetical protein
VRAVRAQLPRTHACSPVVDKYCNPSKGLNAPSTTGILETFHTPMTNRLSSHSKMTGENKNAIELVPSCCMEKKATKMATASGTTRGSSTGEAMAKPSTADRTLMLGVKMPSEHSAARPTSATFASTWSMRSYSLGSAAYRRFRPRATRL